MEDQGSKSSIEGETILDVDESIAAEHPAADQSTCQPAASTEVLPRPPTLSLDQNSEREPSASPSSPHLPSIPPENEPEQQEFNIITAFLGVPHIVEDFFSYLDVHSLLRAQRVCRHWRWVIAALPVWKAHVQHKAKNSPQWRNLFKTRGWNKYLSGDVKETKFYRDLYLSARKDIHSLEENWSKGNYTERSVRMPLSDGFMNCLQCDENKIVAGYDDGRIKIYDRSTLRLMTELRRKPYSSVLCLDFNDEVVISGSEDCCVRVWDITGEGMPQKVRKVEDHGHRINSLKLSGNTLVTGSDDHRVKIWVVNFKAPTTAFVKRTKKHDYAVHAVDINEFYIASGSVDHTIKVWDASTYVLLHKFTAHRSTVQCLQLRGRHLVSGSWDQTMRVWNVENGECLRILRGHERGVYTCSFTEDRICSNTDANTIKVWDFQKAVNRTVPDSAEFCLSTFKGQVGRIVRCRGLHCEDFQLVIGCSRDIVVWDFSPVASTLEELYA